MRPLPRSSATGTVPRVHPSLGTAVGLGFRALVGEAWLVAAGVLVGVARRAAIWPAWAVAAALAFRGAAEAVAGRPFDAGAPFEGALAAVGSSSFVLVVFGLWLAGTAASGALRVAYLAGALPTLAGALAGEEGARRFAPGLAYGFPRVMAAGLLGFALDLSGGFFAWTLVIAAIRITVKAAGTGASPFLAAAVAAALTLAVAVPLALSAFADAGVARAAVRCEGPGRAFAEAARRFRARPGTFVLAALGFALAAVVASFAVEATGGVVTGFARSVSPLLLAGPDLMVALLAIAVGGAVDLWWLGTVAALSCRD